MLDFGVLDFDGVVLCETVRQEAGNKLSLLGVIGGDIMTDQLPIVFPFCIFLQARSKQLGENTLTIRASGPDGPIAEISFVVVTTECGPSAVVTPTTLATFGREGELLVEAKLNDSEWRTALTRRVIKSVRPAGM